MSLILYSNVRHKAVRHPFEHLSCKPVNLFICDLLGMWFLCFPAAHSEVSRQHTPPSVPQHVPRERGERGHLPHRHEEHVQPPAHRAQEIRS